MTGRWQETMRAYGETGARMATISDLTMTLRPVGQVRSTLTNPVGAARQPDEDAPPARIEVATNYRAALAGLAAGDAVLVLTWLHLADRDALTVHPRGDQTRAEVGVFATRSPSRPNPIGVHLVRITSMTPDGDIEVDALEAVDGTPVLDVKPALGALQTR